MAQQIVKDFFVYSTSRFSVAPAATSTQNIQIQADSDFEILKLTFQSDVAAAALTYNARVIPNASVVITDTGSGRQLMNVGMPIASLFGFGNEPFILPMPKIIKARSNLQIVVTSYEAANTDFFSLSFVGNKIFYY